MLANIQTKEQSPAVSVVVATYNRAEFLSETLQTILGQSFKDYEVIVVDDRSTDETSKIIETEGGRIRYFY